MKAEDCMIYSIEDIRTIVTPIAQKHGIPAVFLFGSYARGTAMEKSDIDLLIDTRGTQIRTLLQLGAVYCELEEALQKPIDLVTVRALEQSDAGAHAAHFREAIRKERRPLYVVA